MADENDELQDRLAELAALAFDLARAGKEEQLRLAIERGLPVDLTDWSGNTLVMLAAYHGHAETVAMLAGHGADVNRLNDRYQSPLAGAVFKGEDAVVATLVAAGADPDLGTPTARAAAEMFGRADLFAPAEG
ncbi:ankyrin repeat domain-containing protein [Microlunatus panaciterrae]|uniref:Ankyrin repeat protein n=1 Tax=Microlunatus panaciterrae TaxID=400768 RepID=A0ABS2RJT6_9ACTN|nr:ankyrin repeat domain-containing protein [Microlunatus panaciterrae]MBM7798983.1 ankyrin repeat protein [Microlunatus panaciterrae]